MADIPDSWPPELVETSPRIAPLFPLSNVWLFPRALMPLHIFEPRYRQMIEDSLDGVGRIVMGTVLAGHEQELAGAPPIHPIAGVGQIVGHHRLADGRYNISLLGRGRVRVKEVESDRLYRRVEIEPLIEISVDSREARDLRAQLRKALTKRSRSERKAPKNAPIEMLTDMLLIKMKLPHESLQELFAEPHPARRARGALLEHEQRDT